MKTIKFTLMLMIFVGISSLSYSQNKWSAEFRPDINFPTEDFGNYKIGTGYGFELTGAYRFMEHVSVYAGWSYNTFKLEDSDIDLDVTGYTFGLQFIHPLGTSESLSYLLRAGAIYNHIELKNLEGETIEDSGHGLGYQLEVGLDYSLGTNWNLRPTMRYRALSRDITMETITTNVNLNYLSFGLGIAKTF